MKQKPTMSDPIVRERVDLLHKAETWSREEHEAYQISALRECLTHAGTNVPYYRSLFRSLAFDPDAITSLSQLQQLPLLDKSLVRGCHNEFIAENVPADEIIMMTTGGSTGDPMRVPWDRRFASLNTANTYYYMDVVGFKPGCHASVRLHGDTIPDATISSGEYWLLDDKKLVCSVHHINDETCAGYVARIDEHRPEYIHAYPSALFMLCYHMERSGLRLEAPIPVAFCDSETLYAWQRRKISNVLGCRIFSIYGHTEGAVCAITYPDTDYLHLLPQVGITELIDLAGRPINKQGEIGEIVVTGFNNLVFPMVRYRTGDFATYAPTPSASARNHPMLANVEGRVQDYVINCRGRPVTLAPALFDYQFDYSGIQRFQIRQTEEGKLLFRLVLEAGVVASDIAGRVIATFNEILNHEFEVTAEVVEAIPLTARGKFRYIDQKLDVGIALAD